jgi:hypothetical protein
MPWRFNPFTGNLDLVDTTAAAGSDTQVQFNDGGSLAGDADLTWNKTSNVLGVGGDINLDDGGTYTTTVQVVTPTANRTISFPDATGTVALVAGSSGQLLWNNAGANAGASTLTYDGSILTTSGRFINSYNATASSPAKVFTGTWFTGGTSTTTKPQVLIEPTGATSTAWSTNGTGLGVNAASGFAGNLLDLQVNGTSTARITSSGALTVSDSVISSVGRYYGGATGSHGSLRSSSSGVWFFTDGAGTSWARLCFGGTSSSFPALKRNTTVLETKLADDSAYAQHAASVFQAATAYTVATLPGTPVVGMIARVTDATAPAVGSTVAGGGAAAALVWYNGTNWTVIGV